MLALFFVARFFLCQISAEELLKFARQREPVFFKAFLLRTSDLNLETQFVLSTILFKLFFSLLKVNKEECHHFGGRGSTMRASSVYSEAGQKSVTSDEWIDLEEEETDTENDDRNTNFSRGSHVR